MVYIMTKISSKIFFCFVLFISISIIILQIYNNTNYGREFSFDTFKQLSIPWSHQKEKEVGAFWNRNGVNSSSTKKTLHATIADKPSGRLFSGVIASTGQNFQAEKTRTFPKNEKLNLNDLNYGVNIKARKKKCEKWAVMTTIFPPKEALRKFLYLSNWCVVVVGDKGKPSTFKIHSNIGSNIVFLSDNDQARIQSEFADFLPWQSFSRKNIGYLYAIANGAEIIWDLDDDNILKFWIEGASPDPWLDINKIIELFQKKELPMVTAKTSKKKSFNPYPYLGCPITYCWPRGFPLEQIKEQFNYLPQFLPITGEKKNINLGVLQSLADHEPDVDAIFRLTKNNPFQFLPPKKNSNRSVLMVPKNSMSPFNAQATLFFKSSFFSLYLPFTVNGRVSDIWRSYIAQALFKLLDIHVGFLPRPLVSQDRNVHGLNQDFQAEIPLYTKTGALLQLLQNWTTSQGTQNVHNIPVLLEDIYILMYEYEFVQIEDVHGIQKWISSLIKLKHLKVHGRISPKRPESLKKEDFSVGRIVNKIVQGLPESCVNLPDFKTFWISVLHDGPRVDISSQLLKLNQKILLNGRKGDKTPYPWFPGRHPPYQFVYQNKDVQFVSHSSKTLKNYRTYHNLITNLTEHTQYYRNSHFINKTDTFICSFPASMCQLWLPFNKSMMIMSSHRFNMARCRKDSWREWVSDLIEMTQNSRHFVGGMSRYDYEYLQYYLNSPNITLISSLSGFYLPLEKHPYKPDKKNILGTLDRERRITRSLQGIETRNIGQKSKPYTLGELVSYVAILYYPYAVMSYKITEFYSLGIPLFMPSAKLLRELGGIGADRTTISVPYCNYDEAKWLSNPSNKHPDSYHPYSPEGEFPRGEVEAEMYWTQFADFFDWPHILHFDNVTHLEEMLKKTNFTKIHMDMIEAYKIREYETLDTWCKYIPRI